MAKISELPALANPTGAETVPVIAGDATYRARLSELLEPAVREVKAVLPLVVPQSRASVVTNTPAGTEYAITIPAVFEPLPNGAWIDFFIPEDSLGPIRLTIGNVPTRDIFMVIGQQLRAGWLARVEKNDGGGKWNLVKQIPDGIELMEVKDTADTSMAALANMAGVPLARPIFGNVNEFFVNYSGWVNDAEFEALIVKTNTAANPVVNLADGRRVFALGCPVGALQAGTIAKFVVSFGTQNLYYRGSRPLPSPRDRQPDIWSVLDAALIKPYGDVALGGDGKPLFTSAIVTALGRGSSVATDPNSGRQGASPAGQAPVQVLADCMNEQFGPGLLAKAYNWSHGGHVASQGLDQATEAYNVGEFPCDIMLDCFGMNDMAPAAYNAGQQSPIYLLYPNFYEAELRNRLKFGVKLIALCTSPHPHTGRLTNSFGGNTMMWPYRKEAPVGAEELVPPLSQAVTQPRDWTGSGVLRPGDARGEHVNLMIRNIARRMHADPEIRHRIVLLDVEWAWFRFGVEVYALDQLFNTGEVVHPNLLGHQVSYQRCIREFVMAMRRGRGDQWCFRGEI